MNRHTDGGDIVTIKYRDIPGWFCIHSRQLKQHETTMAELTNKNNPITTECSTLVFPRDLTHKGHSATEVIKHSN